ncbi:receptor-type tyrosine-protein phosphatase epsilon-like isoform X1 [Neodiprion pinetum]|uniref:receptor-type tyrosine-protein phosphatase epsilon-like isoform X1 n=2 Tax=Neodiprion pinetum TaxID=441929 RepID=UPI00371C6FC1
MNSIMHRNSMFVIPQRKLGKPLKFLTLILKLNDFRILRQHQQIIFEDPKNVTQKYSIEKIPIDKKSPRCHLRSAETYYVIVAVVNRTGQVFANITSKPITLKMQPSGVSTTPSHISAHICVSNVQQSWIWLCIFLILLTSFLLLFIWRRKLLKILRQIQREDVISYWQRIMDYVKPVTTCPFRSGPLSLHISTVTDLFPIGNSPELCGENCYSIPISVQNFENYVKESIITGQLKSQFMMFPRGLSDKRRHKYGSLVENKIKNRYANIIPYDDTRVILKKIPGIPCSDYINANYVEGLDKEKYYIAAQGPKPETIEDFWRMVWQEESSAICMLANIVESEKIKCTQYWPEFGSRETYGVITVFIESQKVFADYTFRTFCISHQGEKRKIQHLHYTGWPDHKVPLYVHSVIAYLKKLLRTPVGRGPIIVHCSAGVGRTGTLILCDICLRQAAQTGIVDVLAQFKKLRDCRSNMVDTEMQYVFAHIVMAEYLAAQPTEIPCNNDLPLAIESIKEKLPQHIERLRNTVWQDQTLCPWMRSLPPLPEHLVKNRHPELAPDCSNLVYLSRNRAHNYDDYISAVTVDGFKFKKQFLASQLPMASTISNLWRLIAEQKVELVIILQKPDPDDPTCCDVMMNKESFNPVPSLNVAVKTSSDPTKSFHINEVLLTDKSGGSSEFRQVTVLTCTEWGLGRGGKPPPPKDLVSFWIISEDIHREQGPTLVLCHDGVTGCGLYLALSFVLERMAVERECDIILAVRAVRRARPCFVQSQEQFEYLYNAAAEYIKSFETYANFD